MKKNKWSLVIVGKVRSRGPKAVGISGFFIAFCAIAMVVGLAGFGRLAYMTASYSFAVNDSAEQHRENNRLKDQLENLERFVVQKTESISALASYEDDARLKYGLEAISGDVRQAGVGGIPSSEDIMYSSMTDPLIVKAESLRMQVSALKHRAELQETTFYQIARHAQKVHTGLSKRPAIWPTSGRLTSIYGYRYHPFSGLRLMHEGIDIANNMWTPIYATADGQVKEVSTWTHFGNMIKISHDTVGEYVTLYAHLQKAAVTSGQAVKRGDVIGYMGNTGRSTGSHLHYEVHRNGRPVDPMQFIVPEEQIVD